MQQFVDPYMMGASFQQYDGFSPNPMAPMSGGYAPQYNQQQPQMGGYEGGQYMAQQCPLPTGQGVMQLPTQLQNCSVNNPTFSMQATVFAASPGSSTLCYQPPNLTDLQFPAETQGYGTVPASNMAGNGANFVDRAYVNSARERYTRVACPTQTGVHVGAKRSRDVASSQSHGMPEWSSQWMQGAAPPAHVY
jgi:hypothetical protein